MPSSVTSSASTNQMARLITTRGDRNIKAKNIKFSFRSLMGNFFQKLLNLRWILQLTFFSTFFICSWLFFGFLWWSLEAIGEWSLQFDEHCLTGVQSFYSAVLFSIETQTSIGYGSHYLSNTCYPGFILIFLQVVTGLIVESMLMAIIISKFTHPKFRRADILFSDNICINAEDDNFVLSFRIADAFSGSMSMPEAHVRVYLIHDVKEGRKTVEGCLNMEELDIGYDKS